MSEAVEVENKGASAPKKRKARVRPARAVHFTIWTTNGEPLSESSVKRIEDAIQTATFELFNDGVRVLTQTNRASA